MPMMERCWVAKRFKERKEVISYFKTQKAWLRNAHEESLVLAGAAVLQKLTKMTKQTERGGALAMCSGPLGKHGISPLAIYMQIYNKGDTAAIRGIATVHKRMAHNCYPGKTRRVYSVTQHAVGIIVNKLRTRFLPRELMCGLRTSSTRRAEMASWSGWRERKSKKRAPGFSLLHPESTLLWAAIARSIQIHDLMYKKKKGTWTVKYFS